MLVMIFVNELAGVSGLPWWTYHAHEQQDFMTYVDMVFPFFLFIVGMSMPLAFSRRLERNPSILSLWLHVLLRAIGLVVLGLILANADKVDPLRAGISTPAWTLLALAGAILTWLVPNKSLNLGWLYGTLRVIGLTLLLTAFCIFRRIDDSGHTAWIDASYPEILGLIGFSYVSAAILYIPTMQWIWSPLIWFILSTSYCALVASHNLHSPNLPVYLWPFGNGDSVSITMAGILTSTLFFKKHRWPKLRERILLGCAMAMLMLIAAWLLTPLGISKIRATPTWCLASAGASVISFMLLYWIADVQKKTRWAVIVKPAGGNTLLTYLLPDIYYYLAALLGLTYFSKHLNSGVPGVVASLIFTLAVLAVSALLTKWRIQLQL